MPQILQENPPATVDEEVTEPDLFTNEKKLAYLAQRIGEIVSNEDYVIAGIYGNLISWKAYGNNDELRLLAVMLDDLIASGYNRSEVQEPTRVNENNSETNEDILLSLWMALHFNAISYTASIKFAETSNQDPAVTLEDYIQEIAINLDGLLSKYRRFEIDDGVVPSFYYVKKYIFFNATTSMEGRKGRYNPEEQNSLNDPILNGDAEIGEMTPSLDAPIESDIIGKHELENSRALKIIRLLCDDSSTTEMNLNAEEQNVLEFLREKLNAEKLRILNLHLQGYSLEDIASEMEVELKAVGKKLNSVIGMLRDNLRRLEI